VSAIQLEKPFMSDMMIAVQHVFKSVTDSTGTLTILRDIDFTLNRADTAAIVGASGSGKSTLLSLIAGLDTPSQGTVRLDGQDLFALDEDDRAALRAQKVGFVFQSFQLLANLTALENVMLPLELSRPARRARGCHGTCCSASGSGERLNSYPKVLSGGEQQRVALARAFVVQPAVLLADEPTGSLDFATGEHVMELMFELNREQGTTLVLVTHDRGIAQRCERRITIAAGEVASIEGAPRPELSATGGDNRGAMGAAALPHRRAIIAAKVLFGFHAVGVRLKTAPASMIEVYFERHPPRRPDAAVH
jgi:putative ABC transport system ATP-binding protein